MYDVKIFLPQKTISVFLSAPALLSTLLSDNGVPLDMPCAGNGKCLKCKVRATGMLSDVTELENKSLSDAERAGNIRLACMTYVIGDARIYPADSGKTSKIISGGHMPDFKKKPLGGKFGIAIDIGTTTVAAYLYDLRSCELSADSCAANPQRIFGADVISRMEKSMAGNAGRLAQCVIDCIGRLSGEMCDSRGISKKDIDCIVITGNTAMLYLLTKRDVSCLSSYPFKAATLFGAYADKYELSLPDFPNAAVYLPKCISAYVGADITTAVLSSEMTEGGACSMLVDIGTNGEMALQFSGKLWCCSTAAGPAFEGAGIYMGMNAAAGAVDRVFEDGGAVKFTTVDNAPARGICGSGVIDAAAVFAGAGIIDETGRMKAHGHPYTSRVRELGGEPAFFFENSDVVITQKDIREIQLAKSAICAGLKTLLRQADIEPCAVEKFYIAGGFGSFINIDSAAAIGLFPKELKSKAVVLGNAAGMGACMILLSDEMREKSVRIADRAETVELSTSRYFMDSYIENMMF